MHNTDFGVVGSCQAGDRSAHNDIDLDSNLIE